MYAIEFWQAFKLLFRTLFNLNSVTFFRIFSTQLCLFNVKRYPQFKQNAIKSCRYSRFHLFLSFFLLYVKLLLKTSQSSHACYRSSVKLLFLAHRLFETLQLCLTTSLKYNFHNRKNPEIGEVLVLNDTSSVQASQWNPKRKTAIITHGWVNSGSSPSCTLIRDGK